MFKQKIKNWLGDVFGQFINIAQIQESIILPYKGVSTIEVAAFYCPYVPLTYYTSMIDTNTLITFNTRYGIQNEINC